MPVSYLRKYCFGLAAITFWLLACPLRTLRPGWVQPERVDPNSANLVKYINGRVELRNDAPVGSVAFIRYNVLAGARPRHRSVQASNSAIFDARFLDNGAGHVFLSLINWT